MIGLWPTLAIVIATAFLGTWLLRAQGLAAFVRAQATMAEGRVPVEEVVHGFCLVIAGALLLTPGFLTDAVGFALFLPPVRLMLGRTALRWFTKHGAVQVHTGSQEHAGPHGQAGPPEQPGFSHAQPEQNPRRRTPDIIEGEAEEIDPSSPWAKPPSNNKE